MRALSAYSFGTLRTALIVATTSSTQTPNAMNVVVPRVVAPNQKLKSGIAASSGTIRMKFSGPHTISRVEREYETSRPVPMPSTPPTSRPSRTRLKVKNAL